MWLICGVVDASSLSVAAFLRRHAGEPKVHVGTWTRGERRDCAEATFKA